MGHRFGDIKKMLEKFGGNVFINTVMQRQFQSDSHQVKAIHRHPAGGVGLINVAAGWQWRAAVEYANIIQPQKATLKDVVVVVILAIDPPGEIDDQLVHDSLQKIQITDAAVGFAFRLINFQGCPGVYWRVNVIERPFIGGHLAVGMHIPNPGHQQDLVFGERRIDHRQRHTVKGQIPGGIPGILPFIRHRDDVSVVQMLPVFVAAVLACGVWCRLVGVAVQPLRDIVIIKLFAPDHAGEGLTLNHSGFRVFDVALNAIVKGIGFA